MIFIWNNNITQALTILYTLTFVIEQYHLQQRTELYLFGHFGILLFTVITVKRYFTLKHVPSIKFIFIVVWKLNYQEDL